MNPQWPVCSRDASPDAWGRRVLINRKLGQQGQGAAGFELDELTYLLESGSDRIGALPVWPQRRCFFGDVKKPSTSSTTRWA